ncbi:hypothetical protein M918_16230 [Clostridium sp. BL8]|nr:hypothetical protein M918_16230 [Clostridium sp. BL8]
MNIILDKKSGVPLYIQVKKQDNGPYKRRCSQGWKQDAN